MEGLTPRQAEILQLIREQIEETGMPPTRAEIARALNFKSPNAAESHLRALEKKGVIELVPGSSRGIRLQEEPGLPVVGRVAAGQPILAEQYIVQRMSIDPNIFHPRPDYLLQVKGMSMKDAGILDGDLLAVHRTHDVRNGQVVVARIDGEVTVKRFKRSGQYVSLLPENEDFEPIELDLAHHPLVIEGLAVGVIRAGTAL